jgi:glycosyltransferase involved in cell wall biosynthesis
MRILFAADVSPNPNSGAAGTEYQTIQALRRLGHEVDEIWAKDLPHRIRHGNLHYLFELPRGYRDVIRDRWENRYYDVVHVNQPYAYVAAKDHVISRRPGIFVSRSHGLEVRAEMVLREWKAKLDVRNRSLMRSIPGVLIDQLTFRAQRLVSKFASGHIVSSTEDRQFLMDTYRVESDRIACIPQASPDEFIQTPLPLFETRRLKDILFVGQFVFYKGIHTIAAVADELLSSETNARLIIVCKKHDLAAATGMFSSAAIKRITFLWDLPLEKLLELYDMSGIFLFPSITEGFGKAFLEAMCRGLCVIGTKTAGMKDIIEDGRNGFLVNVGDHKGIIQRIHTIWDNPSLAASISMAARDTASLYTWERFAKELVIFYEKLLSLPRKGSLSW